MPKRNAHCSNQQTEIELTTIGTPVAAAPEEDAEDDDYVDIALELETDARPELTNGSPALDRIATGNPAVEPSTATPQTDGYLTPVFDAMRSVQNLLSAAGNDLSNGSSTISPMTNHHLSHLLSGMPSYLAFPIRAGFEGSYQVFSPLVSALSGESSTPDLGSVLHAARPPVAASDSVAEAFEPPTGLSYREQQIVAEALWDRLQAESPGLDDIDEDSLDSSAAAEDSTGSDDDALFGGGARRHRQDDPEDSDDAMGGNRAGASGAGSATSGSVASAGQIIAESAQNPATTVGTSSAAMRDAGPGACACTDAISPPAQPSDPVWFPANAVEIAAPVLALGVAAAAYLMLPEATDWSAVDCHLAWNPASHFSAMLV